MQFSPHVLSRAIRCLFIGAALVMAGSAVAGPVNAEDTVYVVQQGTVSGKYTLLTVPILQEGGSVTNQTFGAYTGSFNIGVSNSPNGPQSTQLAFCVDPWNWADGSAAPYTRQSLDNLAALSASTYDVKQLVSHVGLIESLYSNYYQSTIGNARQSAAFQLALWEIVTDFGVKYVKDYRDQSTNLQVWTDGIGMVNSLIHSGFKMGSQRYAITSYVVERDQPGYGVVGQNYLVATEIPEPASLGLLGIGLLGLIGLRRKAA